MTFGELRSEVLGWLDESAATSSEQSYANVSAALTAANQAVLTEDRWKFMLYPRTQTLTMVAGQQDYALHPQLGRLFAIRNTNRRLPLVETPSRNQEAEGIEEAYDQDTLRFELTSSWPVAAQPSSASVITLVSSSASDTGAADAVTIFGETASGPSFETITPSGTTPVAGSTAFTAITGITRGATAAWEGTLTLTSNSGSVTNLVLPASENGRQYPVLHLLYQPTAGETVTYRFFKRPRRFSATYDISDIPEPFERILIYDALLLLGAYDNRLDGGRSRLWAQLRDALDLQLRETQLEGQTLGAEGRFIMQRPVGISRLNMPD